MLESFSALVLLNRPATTMTPPSKIDLFSWPLLSFAFVGVVPGGVSFSFLSLLFLLSTYLFFYPILSFINLLIFGL